MKVVSIVDTTTVGGTATTTTVDTKSINPAGLIHNRKNALLEIEKACKRYVHIVNCNKI